MSRYLSIFEVSQKQNFIFSSNTLKTNIRNSDIIAYITSCEFIEETVSDGDLFREDVNLVYSGGGHTILEFPSLENAQLVTSAVTKRILSEYPEVEFFARTIEYDEALLSAPADNIKKLTAELERKKALRRATFHQGSFGVEKVDTGTRRPLMPEMYAPERTESVPDGFRAVTSFEDLGILSGKSNFIAVVHIDGNAMGKRVEELSSSLTGKSWEEYKNTMRGFSEAISEDYRYAFNEMQETIAKAMDEENLECASKTEKAGKKNFPIRRIISEGDDICFVCDGKIGIECAAVFIKKLCGRENSIDHKSYSACAGVAIVHKKYPFYRAYELAEQLCSEAKRFGASLEDQKTDAPGRNVSAIDWHIEYGELQDSLDLTRKQYLTDDGRYLNLRPYIVDAPKEVTEKEPIRNYANFRKLMEKMKPGKDAYASGILKELRGVLKQGEEATTYYLRFHKAESMGRDFYHGIFEEIRPDKVQIGSGKELEKKIFVETADGKTRCILFDAIETMDVYLPIKEVM